MLSIVTAATFSRTLNDSEAKDTCDGRQIQCLYSLTHHSRLCAPLSVQPWEYEPRSASLFCSRWHFYWLVHRPPRTQIPHTLPFGEGISILLFLPQMELVVNDNFSLPASAISCSRTFSFCKAYNPRNSCKAIELVVVNIDLRGHGLFEIFSRNETR